MLSITSSENVTDYKVLGQENPTANTPTVIYTVPNEKSAVLSSIAVCNQSSSTIRYSLAYKPSISNLEKYHYINYNVTIPAYETIVIKGGSLASNYTIIANIQSPNVSVSVFGSEYFTLRTFQINVTSNISIIDSSNILLIEAGNLFAWGLNNAGQLGDGTTTQRLSPKQITSNIWLYISPGPAYSAGITNNGNLYTWGDNSTGQLGDGTTTQRNNPTQIGSNTWIQVATGGASFSDGYTLAIRSDGLLFAWGDNSYGQLGDGTTTQRLTPTQIGGSNTWSYISAGGFHTLAIRSDGLLFAWGVNTTGQIGDGTTTQRLTPTQIGSNTWLQVSAGVQHSLGIRSDGLLFAWGLNLYGRLGDGTTTQRNNPTQIGSNTWLQVSAGDAHSLGIQSDGNLYAWGNNDNRQLGFSTQPSSSTRYPTQVDSNVWIKISGGSSYSAGIQSDGNLYAWGYNGSGQIGDGTTTSPVVFPKKIGSNIWLQVSAGYGHTLGIKK